MNDSCRNVHFIIFSTLTLREKRNGMNEWMNFVVLQIFIHVKGDDGDDDDSGKKKPQSESFQFPVSLYI